MTTTPWCARVRRALVTTALLAGSVLPLRADGVAPANGRTAIHGYDAIAHFVQSKAAKGSREFSPEWNGASRSGPTGQLTSAFGCGCRR